ncbi:hypothetical protein FGK63_06025 [Ruegeria sediminis]|uniref:Uncharacterized protein n=1 Tax=Ruegeria sediminis TaxID=2583820 RepID=A0ABY2X0B6_9RHOB|nr:hypothetical protein [Ruegeria sediminis]TMV08678.1 hypothetical protein FGK63_06025 [Ruegeria sediminis]
MQLPMAGAFEGTRTATRLPRPSPTTLGLYADAKGTIEVVDFGFNEVYRVEARIGTQIAVNPNMTSDARIQLIADARGRMMRYVYGPVYDELIQVMTLMFDEGLHRGDPAFDRLQDMMDTFGRSFKGDV